jgi:hypothetical protein
MEAARTILRLYRQVKLEQKMRNEMKARIMFKREQFKSGQLSMESKSGTNHQIGDKNPSTSKVEGPPIIQIQEEHVEDTESVKELVVPEGGQVIGVT